MCFLFNGITLTNYKGRFHQLPLRNMDWFQSFVSGKGLFQLVLRWEGLVSAYSGWFPLVLGGFGLSGFSLVGGPPMSSMSTLITAVSPS